MAQQGDLAIRNLAKEFRVDGAPLKALDGIDLRVGSGEFLTIVGASGCGKSTLLRLIAGLDAGYDGQILQQETPIVGPSLERGIVFQEARLFPWLNVTENIAIGLENSPLDRAARKRAVADHVALVGLGGFERAYPHQLSGGMAQRVAIARGLVNRPAILLLDEPFGALDALTRARLQSELQQIWARERITMILVTHDVDEAVYLGDRVVVMAPRPGRIARIFDVPLDHPRDRSDERLLRLRNQVLSTLEATIGDKPAGATPLRPPRRDPAVAAIVAARSA
jgi:sulfonate transport system ATP-binding protein